MEKFLVGILVVTLILLMGLFTLCIFIFLKVRDLQQGSCAGVPKFDPTSVYSKTMTIPIIGYKLNGTATFKPDNTFILDFGGTDVFNNNKWIYNTDICSLTVSLDPDLQSTLSKYNSTIDNTIQLNKEGNLIVNGLIEGFVPIQVMLTKK
jgi:hypothetical protein